MWSKEEHLKVLTCPGPEHSGAWSLKEISTERKDFQLPLDKMNERKKEWMDESLMGFVPDGKERSLLSTGRLGFDPYSALTGCVFLVMLLNFPELGLFFFYLQNGDFDSTYVIILL